MAEVIGHKSKKKYRMEMDEKGTKRTFYDEAGKAMDEDTFKAGEGGFDRSGGSERAIKEGYHTPVTQQGHTGYRKPKEMTPSSSGTSTGASLGELAARAKKKTQTQTQTAEGPGTVGDQADALEASDKKKKK